jgi:S-adenosylmethionine:tRNA ribosyltransferase-isomerase
VTAKREQSPVHLTDIDYDLPPHLIAQQPAPRRDGSRLLLVNRGDGSLTDHLFHDLPELLRPGDLLVLNDTRVLPARLIGRRERTGGKWEGLFLRESGGVWEMLCQTRGHLTAGEVLLVEPPVAGSPPLLLRLEEKLPDGVWRARPQEAGSAAALLERWGRVPLPPYIRKGQGDDSDRQRYQTVYAGRPGAVAAPTAGLHFTDEVFARLAERGIGRVFVTLHVGAGTFRPVQAENVAQHRSDAEWCELPKATADAVNDCKARGGRVVAVGSTSVRVLETVAASGPLRPWSGETALTICPPYPFRRVDAIVTNFHLPRSSLLLLVAAFMGLEPMRTAYHNAIERGYRFYSYGDAMLIV